MENKFEFEEDVEFENMEQIVEAIANFVGKPEFLMEPAIGFAA